MGKKILLPNGCSCSKPSVTPANWRACGKSELKRNWQIQYYFYEGSSDKRKLVSIKGMNEYKDLADRRKITQLIIDDELRALQAGYNPFLKKYVTEQPTIEAINGLNEDTPVIKAFRIAHSQLQTSKEYIDQVKYAINRFEKAAVALRMNDIPISKFRMKHYKSIVNHLNLPNGYYNKYKAYFSTLYDELIEWECCEYNITRDVKKKVVEKKQREVLTLKEVDAILEHLRPQHEAFYRYAKIFEYSASRSAELLTVQTKHVDLINQEYKILTKKGKRHQWVTRVIIRNAIPFWTEILLLSKSPDDYLFSHGLVPGAVPNTSKQITIRWRHHVKYKLVFKDGKVYDKKYLDDLKDYSYTRITADFYAMKHMMLDHVDNIRGLDAAQEFGGHTKASTTRIYTVGHVHRENEVLKKLAV